MIVHLKGAMYLWRKDSGFFFQMRIPAGHVVNLGATPFRIWLGTLKKREAQRRATVLAAAAVEGINAGMDRETLTRSLKALAPKIDALGREEFSVWLVAAGHSGFLRQVAEEGDGDPDPKYIASYREKIAGGTPRVSGPQSSHAASLSDERPVSISRRSSQLSGRTAGSSQPIAGCGKRFPPVASA